MFAKGLLFFFMTFTNCQGQCQIPGNALCWLFDEDLVIGNPCCDGSGCLPHPSDSKNSFCQYIQKIKEGDYCGNRVGICEDGLTCISDVCSTGTTFPPVTTSSAGCAATGGVCWSPTDELKNCCLDTDSCTHWDADGTNTFICHGDCAQSGQECYGLTTPLKTCCVSSEKCVPIGNSPDTFTCQEEFGCAATGATCFSFDNPNVVECCDAADTCEGPDADNIFTCEGHCAKAGDSCYDSTAVPPAPVFKSWCTDSATCVPNAGGTAGTCSA